MSLPFALEQVGITHLPQTVVFTVVEKPAAPFSLTGQRIAVARDAAFPFICNANLDLLRAMGAEMVFFSPLADSALPHADSVYLPGGYPGLYLERLAANHGMRNALRSHQVRGKPLVAECGGMLCLLESLTGALGRRAPWRACCRGTR